MNHKNPITRKMLELDMLDKEASRAIYEKYYDIFLERNLMLTERRFNLVKNGHDRAPWLRDLLSDYFGVPEKKMI